MNVLAFDIETVPDTDLGRRLYDVGDLDDADVARIMFCKQRQATGREFLPVHQHRVVAISGVRRLQGDRHDLDSLHVFSLGDETASEREIVQEFFLGLAKYSPDLVTWNGQGFDLPVLHYRALLHGVDAGRYWETGETDSEFRYNSYLSRFHWRHLDLMDALSGFQARARASLEHMATLLGLPGKLGMSGDAVWEKYLAGDLAAIRQYCEMDALNTWLVYLRFQLMRGVLDRPRYDSECDRLAERLRDCGKPRKPGESGKPHLIRFLGAWRPGDDGG